MTLLDSIGKSPLAAAAGWALFHSLWQGAILAVLLAAALAMFRSARIRYAAACLSLATMLVCFAGTFLWLLPRNEMPAGNWPAPPFSWRHLVAESSVPSVPLRRLSDFLPWLAPFWLAGVTLFYVRRLMVWNAARRLRRVGVCAAADPWQERLNILARRLRLTRPVALLESCVAAVPVVIGHARPIILMPVGLLAGLPPGQIESILVHELAHILRRDYLVNMMQTAIEGLFFYHPAVWWTSRVIRKERENCCDDLAVMFLGNAHEYAAALAALEENRRDVPQAALAATGGDLVNRIRRLLIPAEHSGPAIPPVALAGVLMLLATAGVAAWETKPPKPPQPQMQARPPIAAQVEQSPVIPQAQRPQAAVEPVPLVQRPQEPQVPQAPQRPQQPQQLAQVQTPQQPQVQQQPQVVMEPPAPVTPYTKWVNEDVVYIITDRERDAFKRLRTDEERSQFIQQFWLRRDPTPGTPQNEMMDEHYRRIAYANLHFPDPAGIPGWKTDRGRIYVMFGPPDERDEHPAGDATRPYPYDRWLYRYIQSVGSNVYMDFVDTTRSGRYVMTTDPNPQPGDRIVRPQDSLPH